MFENTYENNVITMLYMNLPSGNKAITTGFMHNIIMCTTAGIMLYK